MNVNADFMLLGLENMAHDVPLDITPLIYLWSMVGVPRRAAVVRVRIIAAV